MNKIIPFFKLIRLPNLLMIGLVQYITYAIIWDARINIDFMLMSLATVFIALGGYLINDFYDYDLDIINGQDKRTSKKNLLYFSFGTFLTGLSIGIVGIIPNYILGLYYLMPIIFLIIYARYISKYKLVGNVIIALVVGYSIFFIPIVQKFLMKFHYDNSKTMIASMSTIIFSFFAFGFIWVREIVKDIEDYKGDKAYNRKTWATILGTNQARFVPIVLLLVLLIGLTISLFSLSYPLILVLTTICIFLTVLLYFAKEKKDYTRISLFLKIIMLIGVLSPLFL